MFLHCSCYRFVGVSHLDVGAFSSLVRFRIPEIRLPLPPRPASAQQLPPMLATAQCRASVVIVLGRLFCCIASLATYVLSGSSHLLADYICFVRLESLAE
jgi:hypothetical protein